MSSTRPVLGVAMVTTAATVWALNGTVSKLLIQGGFDPPRLTTFRATGAFLVLLLPTLVTAGPRSLLTTRRELPVLVVYGLIGLFAVPLLYFVAISRLPVSIGLLFEFTAPVFIALWVRFGERAQVRRRLWFGLVLSLVGLITVAQIWTILDTHAHLRLDALGILAGLTSALLLGTWYVLGGRFVGGTRPTRDPLTLTCWGFAAAAVAGAVVRPWWTFDWALLGGRGEGLPMWLLAAYLIVFGTVVPYLLLTFAMRHLPPTSVGIIGMTEIIMAGAFAWFLLGEALGPVEIVGGLVLLAGVALAESARVRSAGPDMRTNHPRQRAEHPPDRAEHLQERTAHPERMEDPRREPPTVPAGR